ncbi:hypothetical protein RISK_001067 [Rhodopirellula islandica]|uniref:Uncharacterized protein n=1 Tax=Rhodopirellula islandica TaxID=595434 RepID=A0A0J1BL54_RHOIS|nr:hypothetical protein RISK_001067 [Rhodopirellula islandica]
MVRGGWNHPSLSHVLRTHYRLRLIGNGWATSTRVTVAGAGVAAAHDCGTTAIGDASVAASTSTTISASCVDIHCKQHCCCESKNHP